MDANQYDSWMRRRKRPQSTSTNPLSSDSRAAQRIMPGMRERNEETRQDRILKAYRGRDNYEGQTDPEVV